MVTKSKTGGVKEAKVPKAAKAKGDASKEPQQTVVKPEALDGLVHDYAEIIQTHDVAGAEAGKRKLAAQEVFFIASLGENLDGADKYKKAAMFRAAFKDPRMHALGMSERTQKNHGDSFLLNRKLRAEIGGDFELDQLLALLPLASNPVLLHVLAREALVGHLSMGKIKKRISEERLGNKSETRPTRKQLLKKAEEFGNLLAELGNVDANDLTELSADQRKKLATLGEFTAPFFAMTARLTTYIEMNGADKLTLDAAAEIVEGIAAATSADGVGKKVRGPKPTALETDFQNAATPTVHTSGQVVAITSNTVTERVPNGDGIVSIVQNSGGGNAPNEAQSATDGATTIAPAVSVVDGSVPHDDEPKQGTESWPAPAVKEHPESVVQVQQDLASAPSAVGTTPSASAASGRHLNVQPVPARDLSRRAVGAQPLREKTGRVLNIVSQAKSQSTSENGAHGTTPRAEVDALGAV